MRASGEGEHEFVPSAHFPRITKHDLEVVVEAMDKLREALQAEEATETPTRWKCGETVQVIKPNITSDRELVEKPEGLREVFCAKLGANEPCAICFLCDELLAVLAARNEGGTK